MKHSKRNIVFSSLIFALSTAFYGFAALPWAYWAFKDHLYIDSYYVSDNINGFITSGFVFIISVILFAFAIAISKNKIVFSKRLKIAMIVLLGIINFFENEIFLYDTIWAVTYETGPLVGYYVLASIEIAIFVLSLINFIFILKENCQAKQLRENMSNRNTKKNSSIDVNKAYENLSKLKKLLDEGIITEEEYQEKRKKYVDCL